MENKKINLGFRKRRKYKTEKRKVITPSLSHHHLIANFIERFPLKEQLKVIVLYLCSKCLHFYGAQPPCTQQDEQGSTHAMRCTCFGPFYVSHKPKSYNFCEYYANSYHCFANNSGNSMQHLLSNFYECKSTISHRESVCIFMLIVTKLNSTSLGTKKCRTVFPHSLICSSLTCTGPFGLPFVG